MFGGFTFDGIDIDKLDLEYAPDNANTYVYKPTSKTVSEQKFEGHEGGYYYGETPAPKDFVLRCFYTGTVVTEGLMSRIYQAFKVGKSGKLIFKQRPWCWYIATVVNVDITQLLNYANGFVTITMRAYYPYARTDMFTIPDFTDYALDIKMNSGLLLNPERMPNYKYNVIGLDCTTPITERTDFIVYNPGTEKAKVAIEIAGDVGDGIVITNRTTGQKCKFVGITKAETTNKNRYIVSDALNGKTVITGGNESTKLAFLYHDKGFIDLAPSYPIIRDVEAKTLVNDSKVYLDKIIDEDVIGKYIYIGTSTMQGAENPWKKITGVEDDEMTVSTDNFIGLKQTIVTDIVTMNEITITPVSTMSLTRFNFVYLPTFA